MPNTDRETAEAIAQARGWMFSTKDLNLPAIEDEKGCREFFMLLYTRFGLVWHPDNSFEDYVDLKTGMQRVFSPRACDLMDGAMAKCFEILGERVYDVALETDEEWRRQGQPDEAEARLLQQLQGDPGCQ